MSLYIYREHLFSAYSFLLIRALNSSRNSNRDSVHLFERVWHYILANLIINIDHDNNFILHHISLCGTAHYAVQILLFLVYKAILYNHFHSFGCESEFHKCFTCPYGKVVDGQLFLVKDVVFVDLNEAIPLSIFLCNQATRL